MLKGKVETSAEISSDDQSDKECPLCMEQLEIDDVNFYPCKCEYQICRFCWHRIRTDENGLCPACRQPYPEDPVNFKPLTASDLQKIKTEKKQKLQQQRMKISESRKHLASYRVLQKNLVYVIGLSPRVADTEVLKKTEYFGKFGRILKVAVGTSSNNAPQSASCTAYVTYARYEDALRAIQAVNNAQLDGRTVKASLGTTKYCSSFLRSQPCQKPECMYLHDVADSEVSFTKEDMHTGKHADYERKLIETTLMKDKAAPHLTSGSRRKHSQSADRKGSSPLHSSPINIMGRSNGKSPVNPLQNTDRTMEAMDSEDGVPNGERSGSAMAKSESTGSVAASEGSPLLEVTSKEVLCEMNGKEERSDQSSRAQSSAEPSQFSENTLPSDEPPTRLRSRLLQWTSSPGPEISSTTEGATTCDKIEKMFLDTRGNGFMEPNVGSENENISHSRKTSSAAGGCDWQRMLGIGVQKEPEKANKEAETAAASAPPVNGVHCKTSRHSCLSAYSDDDLGFDPCSESAKGLANLLEEEKEKAVARQRAHHTSAAPSMNSSLMSLGLQCGWPSVSTLNGGCGTVYDTGYSSGSVGMQSARPNNYFMAAPEPNYFISSSVRPPAAGQPSHATNLASQRQQQHQQMMFALASQQSPPSAYGHSSLKPQMLAAIHYQEPPPGLHLYASHQPRHSPFNAANNSVPIAPVHTAATDASQLNEWQEGFKALLPNVNVRFVQELSSTGYSSSRPTVSAPGSSLNSSQQPQHIMLNGYGQAAPCAASQQMGASHTAPLTMLSLNSLAQPVHQWMPPPPGFSHIAKH